MCFERCNCVLQNTHGFSCTCVLFVIEIECDVVYLDKINPFWKTLRHVEGGDTNEDVYSSNAYDARCEVYNLVHEDHLHPYHINIPEP